MANAKGISLIDMVKYLRSRRDEAAALLPSGLRQYLDKKINIASWYPEEDMVALVRVVARLLPASGEEPLLTIGRLNARHHMAGAYRHLFDSPDLSGVPLRARTLWQSMHDTGDFRVTLEEGEARADISGYGHPSREMCTMVGSYTEELFIAAGAKQLSSEHIACRLDGDAVCSYRIRWAGDGD